MRISDWSSDVCSSDLVGDIVAEAAPPGLAAVDARGDGGGRILRDHHPVLPAEIAIEPSRVIVNAVVRRKQCCIDIVLTHPGTQFVLPPRHFGIGEDRKSVVSGTSV